MLRLEPHVEASTATPDPAPPPMLEGPPGAVRREPWLVRQRRQSPIQRVARFDIRRATPRQIAELSLDLYLAGLLEWDEYAMVAFQPELHPDYDRTVGALTGQPAQPDRPRDIIAEWEERLAFEEKYNARDKKRLRRFQRIVALFRRMEAAIRDVA